MKQLQIKRVFLLTLFFLVLSASIVYAENTAGTITAAGGELFDLLAEGAKMIGAIVFLVGIVKYAMAYQSADGPEYQKSILMIVSGVGLIGVPSILKKLFYGMGSKPSTADIMTAILLIARTIITMAGAIFLLTGIVRFVMAHQNDDGNSLSKAMLMIAVGIAMIVIVTAIKVNQSTGSISF